MPGSNAGGSRVTFADPHVNLYTDAIEPSLQFYRDVLGFRETFRTPRAGSPSHVELTLGSFKLGVATLEALRRDHGIEGGLGPARMEIALFTGDVDGAYGWSTARGAPSLTPPQDFGGYIRHAIVADPVGNPIVFTTRLPVRGAADPAARPTITNHLVNLYSADMARSLRFYVEVLGFTETFRVPKQGAPDHVEFELGSLNLAVSSLEALKRDHGLSGGGGPPRGEVVLWVEDVDRALSWLNEQGAPTLSRPHRFAGVLHGAWVADPDGNPVQLVSRPGAL